MLMGDAAIDRLMTAPDALYWVGWAVASPVAWGDFLRPATEIPGPAKKGTQGRHILKAFELATVPIV